MKLTLVEAAGLVSLSPRTLRARIQAGQLKATREGHRWVLELADLPLTREQQEATLKRAERARVEVAQALPGRLDRTRRDERTLLDLDAFRLPLRGAAQANALGQPGLADLLVQVATGVAEAALLYEREHKLQALRIARSSLARATTLAWANSELDPSHPLGALAAGWERELVPALAGYARWVSTLGRRP